MKPTVDDVLTALELIASRVPDRHITPDIPMAATWADDLARYPRDAIFRAAREWGGLRFPAASEFIAAVQQTARQIAVEEQARYAAGELEPGTCPEGCESGAILGTTEHRGMTYVTTRPCEACQPVPYAIWRHSAGIPNHRPERCPDCIQIRSGKDPAPQWLIDAREAAAGRRDTLEQF
jgi:hypothetical protein